MIGSERVFSVAPTCPKSIDFLNISTPVHVVFCVGARPTISSSSPVFSCPCSIRPVATVLVVSKGRILTVQLWEVIDGYWRLTKVYDEGVQLTHDRISRRYLLRA